MPIYEYQCSSCDFSFEERQGFDAATTCACPQCRNTARRLFNPAPIIFKGKGFYVTDYPSASSTTARSKSEESSVTPKKETEAKPKVEAAKSIATAD